MLPLSIIVLALPMLPIETEQSTHANDDSLLMS